MKKIFYLSITLLAYLTTSCLSYGIASYDLSNTDNLGSVQDNSLTVNYDKFSVSYDAGDKSIIVFNKSDSSMFVDLGESYAILKDGQADRLFTNSVTSNYSSGTTGSTVNLGAVAGAFGVGGSLGKLANGINVGNSNTNGTTVQTFEERYHTIPPHTSIKIKFKQLVLPELTAKKSRPLRYDADNTPVSVGNLLSYTFDPEGKNWKSIRNFVYVNGIERQKYKNAKAIADMNKTKFVIDKVDPIKTTCAIVIPIVCYGAGMGILLAALL